jgi:hypothetical protein
MAPAIESSICLRFYRGRHRKLWILVSCESAAWGDRLAAHQTDGRLTFKAPGMSLAASVSHYETLHEGDRWAAAALLSSGRRRSRSPGAGPRRW